MKSSFLENKKSGIREEVLQEAEFIKNESGEIPEIYFWNCYFYLTTSPPKGKGLKLSEEEILFLKKAVVERYFRIIKRDITPENIGKPFYRGVSRAITNLKRLENFLKNQKLENEYKEDIKKIKEEIENFKKEYGKK